MGANSRLLIIELVLPDDARPSMGKLLDLEMLSVTPNGRQRTEAQYVELLARAGLRPLSSLHCSARQRALSRPLPAPNLTRR
jgi:hypothetical protein